jgi:FkbM family methyltransferase
MSSQLAGHLVEAVGRVCALVTTNSSAMGDRFERIAELFYSKVVRRGDTVIDGGAHTGRHTIPLARLVGDDGLVLAFEPLASANQTLGRLLAGFRFDARVQLRLEALAQEPGRRRFFVVTNMPEFSGLTRRQYVDFVPNETEVEVDVDTIDAALNAQTRSGPLSFIKLDLEGGEFRALQGAEQTLREHTPCCVFENGLGSSADEYTADDFFGYFKRLEYDLYDILGCPVNETRWNQPGPWYFVALHRAQSVELLALLWTSVLEEHLTSPWFPTGQTGPPPASCGALTASRDAHIRGHVDHVETSIRISGWVGNSRTGQPARSLMVIVDGVPVATTHPGRPRYDVLTATGQPGFAHSGFDAIVRISADHRIEVYGEADDGTFFKLAGP